VPVIGIVLLVQLVTSQRSADPNALTPKRCEAIQPVGHVEFGAGGGRGGRQERRGSGEEVCARATRRASPARRRSVTRRRGAAHQGRSQRAGEGPIKGIRGMPPKGGNPSSPTTKSRAR